MTKDEELQLKRSRIAPEDPETPSQQSSDLAARIARLEDANASRHSAVLAGQIAKLREIKALKDAEGGS